MIDKMTNKTDIRCLLIDFLSVILIVILFVISSSVVADPVKPISSANSGYIFQVFMGLVIVILMIFAVAAIAKRFGAGSMLNNQHMRIVSTLALGAKEKIVVVEAGEKQFLLGITAQQINQLYTFEEPIVDLKTKKEVSEFTKKIQGFLNPVVSSKNESSQRSINQSALDQNVSHQSFSDENSLDKDGVIGKASVCDKNTIKKGEE